MPRLRQSRNKKIDWKFLYEAFERLEVEGKIGVAFNGGMWGFDFNELPETKQYIEKLAEILNVMLEESK